MSQGEEPIVSQEALIVDAAGNDRREASNQEGDNRDNIKNGDEILPLSSDNSEDSPIKGEARISRDSYWSDEIEDIKNEDKRSCLNRYFGPIRGGSLRGSILSMASIVFGLCGLTFPIGYENIGLIPALTLLIWICSVCYWSWSAWIETGRKKKILNYGLLIKECLGPRMSLLSDINNIVWCIGILMSYEFTINSFFLQILSKFIDYDPSNEKLIKAIQVGVCMVWFQIPLSWLRNISKLQYASIVGCFTLWYTAIVILVEAPFYYEENIKKGAKIEWFKPISLKIFDSFSIFLYGFASHNGILPVFNELSKPSRRRSFVVLNRAFLLEFMIFLVIGLSGFFSLFNENTPSLFNNRPDLQFTWMKFDYFMLTSRILFVITLHCTIAINNNILRNSFKSLLYDGKDIPFKWDFLGVIVWLSWTNAVTFFIDDVLKIISIIGSICAVIACFLSPILCWVSANGLPYTHIKNVTAWTLLVVIMIIGLSSAVYSIIIDIQGA